MSDQTPLLESSVGYTNYLLVYPTSLNLQHLKVDLGVDNIVYSKLLYY